MLNWQADAFKREIVSKLVANGELAGKFVENEAKRRLLGITDPDWGRAYRGYVARLIDSEVETEAKAVVIRVGVRISYTEWHGFYIETGTRRRAAHPFLRPAVFSNGRKIVTLLEGR